MCTAATIPWKEGGGGVGALPNMAPDKYISPLLHEEEEGGGGVRSAPSPPPPPPPGSTYVKKERRQVRG